MATAALVGAILASLHSPRRYGQRSRRFPVVVGDASPILFPK